MLETEIFARCTCVLHLLTHRCWSLVASLQPFPNYFHAFFVVSRKWFIKNMEVKYITFSSNLKYAVIAVKVATFHETIYATLLQYHHYCLSSSLWIMCMTNVCARHTTHTLFIGMMKRIYQHFWSIMMNYGHGKWRILSFELWCFKSSNYFHLMISIPKVYPRTWRLIFFSGVTGLYITGCICSPTYDNFFLVTWLVFRSVVYFSEF